MVVGLTENPDLFPVKGIRLAACTAGIYKKPRPDLVLVECATGASTAAVFTRNVFCAAPVQVAREHLARQSATSCLLINAGNANAGMGHAGLQAAQETCAHLAQLKQVPVQSVLPFSTGVIGEPLPVSKICAALPELINQLDENHWAAASRAIMTTDTVPKAISRQGEVDGHTITLTGMAKGSGMIRPNMATMLAFITTDAAISQNILQLMLNQAVGKSFNRISVDGDTSTNDACVVIATGKAGNPLIEDIEQPAAHQLAVLLEEVCMYLAQSIIRDGEGATKFVTLDIINGRNIKECEEVAAAIAHSPLIKTALFASDPNWGRILAAIGRAGINDFDIRSIEIHINDVCIVRNGGRDPDYTEEQGRTVFSRPEITIRVNLNLGESSVRYWTCDFSYDYVRINAEYRT